MCCAKQQFITIETVGIRIGLMVLVDVQAVLYVEMVVCS